MEVANNLAYYDTATITAVKCFIVQAPGVKLKKIALQPQQDKLVHFENYRYLETCTHWTDCTPYFARVIITCVTSL